MRTWLTAIYVVAALITLVPALGFVVAMHSSPWGPRPLDFAIATLFNPLLIGEVGLATWYGSIAWRSTTGLLGGFGETMLAAGVFYMLLAAWSFGARAVARCRRARG